MATPMDETPPTADSKQQGLVTTKDTQADAKDTQADAKDTQACAKGTAGTAKGTTGDAKGSSAVPTDEWFVSQIGGLVSTFIKSAQTMYKDESGDVLRMIAELMSCKELAWYIHGWVHTCDVSSSLVNAKMTKFMTALTVITAVTGIGEMPYSDNIVCGSNHRMATFIDTCDEKEKPSAHFLNAVKKVYADEDYAYAVERAFKRAVVKHYGNKYGSIVDEFGRQIQ